MDQKAIEKMKLLKQRLDEQEKAFNAEYKTFQNEMCNPDVLRMLRTINDHLKSEGVSTHGLSFFRIALPSNRIDDVFLELYAYANEMCIHINNSHLSIALEPISELRRETVYQNDDGIQFLTKRARQLAEKKEWLTELVANAEWMITKITEKYEEITATQFNALNELAALLECDNESLKHIKITVEYV